MVRLRMARSIYNFVFGYGSGSLQSSLPDIAFIFKMSYRSVVILGVFLVFRTHFFGDNSSHTTLI